MCIINNITFHWKFYTFMRNAFQVSSTAEHKDESLEMSVGAADRAESAEGGDAPEDGPGDDAQHLVKLSYHDSGIDIRDPVLHVTPTNAKKVRHDIVHPSNNRREQIVDS